MDIQPFISALLVADPPTNSTPEVRPDPSDIMLVGQDFPLLASIAEGMDCESAGETHGRLAGFYHVYTALEGEFGELPFGSLDLVGPTMSDQAEADTLLDDQDQSADLITRVAETFPNLGATIGKLGESDFHVGVLVAYCATWLWLQGIDTVEHGDDPAEFAGEQAEDVDPLADLDAMGFADDDDDDDDEPVRADFDGTEWIPESDGSDEKSRAVDKNPSASRDEGYASRPPMIEPHVANDLLSVMRDLDIIGMRDTRLTPSVAASGMHTLTLQCVYERTASVPGQAQKAEHLLDIGKLADSAQLFHQITDLAPTVTVDSQGLIHFRAVIAMRSFANAPTLRV